MLTYNCKLIFQSNSDRERLVSTLNHARDIYNVLSIDAYEFHVTKGRFGLMDLHKKSYQKLRDTFPDSLSQIVIRCENDVTATYASIRSNKHKIDSAPLRKNSCLQLDKRLYTWKDRDTISIAALGGKRINCTFQHYTKVDELLSKYTLCDPNLFIRSGEVFISLIFNNPDKPIDENFAIGIDLGMRFLAVTSDGKAIKGNKFNSLKRKIRHHKKSLQSKGTKSAKKRLRKIKNREAKIADNYIHSLANELLNTEANILVLEDLAVSKMKAKKHKNQSKAKITQVSFTKTRSILEYKAKALGKTVITVSPAYTSQDDYRGITKGERRGRRYYTRDGKIFDADLNAAINIALKSKHSVSFVPPLDGSLKPVNGQAFVNTPIVGSLYQTHLQATVL